MKILSLEIVNFLAIGNSGTLKLDGQGLVLIQGINLDDSSAASNGVGKSSIPDALSWVNFGETARGVTGDAVVNIAAKKNCAVREVVQVGENRYVIERYRKHATYKNQIRVLVCGKPGDEPTDISKGTDKETQALIEQILGCSKDVFMAAIYAGQETAPDLPSMTDKQLKMLIEEAAGVSKIETALQVARGRAATVNAQLETTKRDHASMNMRLTDEHARLVRLNTALTDFESQRTVLRDERLKAAKGHLMTAAGYRTELKEFPDQETMDARIAAIDEQLVGHKKLVDAGAAATRAFAALELAADRAKTELQRLAKDMERIKLAIKNAPEELKKPCPECAKPHTEDELDQFVAHLNASLVAKVGQVREQGVVWEKAKQDVLNGALTVDEAKAKIPDVVAISEEKAGLVAKKHAISRLNLQIEECMKAARREKDTAENVMTMENPHGAELKRTHEAIEKFMESLDALQKKQLDLEARAAIADHVVKVFGPAGVRAHILDTVTPFLNAQTADYLSTMSDGNITATWATLSTTAKGELREKFNIDVANDKGADTFKGLSGGEKRKVRLSTMLALQDLVATRASNPIQLWIGDEIDDALDKSGLERLMSVLERKAREKGTVLIISHNSLTDWCDRVAVVTKEGGKSTIAGALG